MNLLIHYRGIVEERMQDAPFIGALVLAADCHNNCPGCFNQYLKDEPLLTNTASEIVKQIQSNPLHQGIIFGGLEWTEQAFEMNSLLAEAMKNNLKIAIYTHHGEKYMREQFPSLFAKRYHEDVYIKFGKYDETRDTGVKAFGVQLATANQYMKRICTSRNTK